MTLESWLTSAVADAERRGLSGLRPPLEALARAMAALRAADFNDRANGGQPSHGGPQPSAAGRQQ
jgi:hypothetical protein